MMSVYSWCILAVLIAAVLVMVWCVITDDDSRR